MAAPTFVAEYETVFSNSTSPKTTSSFDAASGDVLVVLTVAEGNGVSWSTPTNTQGAETWTLRQEISAANYCRVAIWTAVMSGAKTGMTVSVAEASPTGQFWGANVLHWTDSDGVGNSSSTNVNGGAPSLVVETGGDNSAICVANGDWNAGDGTSRTWRSVNGAPATERTYFRDSSLYTVYIGSYTDAGAAGFPNVGLSAPSGQKYTIAAVEILGSAGGGGTTHQITTSGSGTTGGSVPLRLTMALAATGSGTSGGVVALRRTTTITASGTGTTGGSVALQATLQLTASGSGTSGGTAALTLASGAITHDIAATGSGTTGGSVALRQTLQLTASGSGATSGSAALTVSDGSVTHALSASGSGTTSGSAALVLHMALSASGSGTTGGSVTLGLTASLSASGASQTGGSVTLALVGSGTILTLTASGAGATSGELALSRITTLTATGSGASGGACDARLHLGITATGLATSGGTLSTSWLLHTRALGHTQSGGSVALRMTMQLTAGVANLLAGVSPVQLGTATVTPDVTYDGASWHRIAPGVTNHGVRYNAELADLVDGQTYTGSVELANDTGAAVSVLVDWCDSPPSSALTLQPGDRSRVYVTATRADYTSTFRFLDVAVSPVGGSVLVRAPMLNVGTSVTPYLETVPGSTTSGSVELRLPISRITTTGYSTTGGSVVLSQPMFRFTPPTHEEPMRTRVGVLEMYRLTYSTTVLKRNGIFIALRVPDPALLEGLVEGIDFFRGGHEYEVTRAISDQLALAGFTSTPI